MENPDVSIVMAYFNHRKEQTINTLNRFQELYADLFKFELIILTSLVPSLWSRLLLLLIRSQSRILLCPCVINLELIIPSLLCPCRNRTVTHVLTRC